MCNIHCPEKQQLIPRRTKKQPDFFRIGIVNSTKAHEPMFMSEFLLACP